LLVTVLVSWAFFWLATQSYASMAKIEIGAAATGRAEGRYPDDGKQPRR